MNKFIKALSLILVLTGTVYLPSANAASTGKTTSMLITLAETDPVLVERLNDIALTDTKLLKQILKMAGTDPVKLEKLVDLAETDIDMFWTLANIYNTNKMQEEEEQQMSTFGTIDDGGVIQN